GACLAIRAGAVQLHAMARHDGEAVTAIGGVLPDEVRDSLTLGHREAVGGRDDGPDRKLARHCRCVCRLPVAWPWPVIVATRRSSIAASAAIKRAVASRVSRPRLRAVAASCSTNGVRNWMNVCTA